LFGLRRKGGRAITNTATSSKDEERKKSEEVETKHIVANTRSHLYHTTWFTSAVVASLGT
jgi:hypothetical protein